MNKTHHIAAVKHLGMDGEGGGRRVDVDEARRKHVAHSHQHVADELVEGRALDVLVRLLGRGEDGHVEDGDARREPVARDLARRLRAAQSAQAVRRVALRVCLYWEKVNE